MAAKRGRPFKDEGDKAHNRVELRLTDVQLDLLSKVADKADQPLATWIRIAALEKAVK